MLDSTWFYYSWTTSNGMPTPLLSRLNSAIGHVHNSKSGQWRKTALFGKTIICKMDMIAVQPLYHFFVCSCNHYCRCLLGQPRECQPLGLCIEASWINQGPWFLHLFPPEVRKERSNLRLLGDVQGCRAERWPDPLGGKKSAAIVVGKVLTNGGNWIYFQAHQRICP